MENVKTNYTFFEFIDMRSHFVSFHVSSTLLVEGAVTEKFVTDRVKYAVCRMAYVIGNGNLPDFIRLSYHSSKWRRLSW